MSMAGKLYTHACENDVTYNIDTLFRLKAWFSFKNEYSCLLETNKVSS